MKLDSIQISNFRNLTEVSVLPSPTLNLVYGSNGSGKSSLLEAIHFLGYGRSFRTNKAKLVIQRETSQFNIFAKCSSFSEQESSLNNIQKRLGISRNTNDEFVCSVDGERSKRISDIVSLVPVQVFTPQSIEELIGSPSARRRFVDWGLFHVEHETYSELTKSYKKVVKQRNALLKQISYGRKPGNKDTNQLDSLDYWNSQLVLLGERIHFHRKNYVELFQEQFLDALKKFLPEIAVKLSYYRGWDSTSSLADVLTQKQDFDIRSGQTNNGPHKADLKLKLEDNRLAVDVLSRGQMRMLVAALHVAQTNLLNSETSEKGVFLLDDIGAELDSKHRNIFITELLRTGTQLFITAIEKSQFSLSEEIHNKKMFHVKHGHVIEEQ